MRGLLWITACLAVAEARWPQRRQSQAPATTQSPVSTLSSLASAASSALSASSSIGVSSGATLSSSASAPSVSGVSSGSTSAVTASASSASGTSASASSATSALSTSSGAATASTTSFSASSSTTTTSSAAVTCVAPTSSSSSTKPPTPSTPFNATYPGTPGIPNNSSNGTYYPSASFPAPLNTSLDGHSLHASDKWAEAHAKARARLVGWTLDQKMNLTTGVGWEQGLCVGNTPAIPAQGYPGLCLQDSPLGVRDTDFNSAFPAGINVASTFDKDLMYQRGLALGRESKGKGVNVQLGPMTNMGRVAAGGRNWEGFGGDPYLSGIATEHTIRGMQDAGVQACVKHYVGNEQEHSREHESSNIPDRAMREIYSHPFLRAVAADVAAVMCSYNLVNNSWACQNEQTLNGILKTDFGFQGYVVSDWSAQHSGVASANAGLDMTMPGDMNYGSLNSYWGQNLTESVRNGSVPADRLDDMAERILAAYYLVGQDQPGYPNVSFDSFRLSPGGPNASHVNVQADHYKVIRQIGAASTVLLKNVNNTLPLSNPRSIALIGSDAGPSIKGPNGCGDRACDLGTLAMGWGSGTANFPYLVDPLTAISQKLMHTDAQVQWWLDDWDLSGVATLAQNSEVCMVFGSSDSGEAYLTVDGNEGDRNNLTLWNNAEQAILYTAGNCSNTVVVIHSVGPIDMEPWIDHPNVTAVLWAGIPGQESGNGLVDVLFGDYNPSAKLPYTIAKNRLDYPADVVYVDAAGPPSDVPQITYTEGLHIDYRHFLQQNITPRYEFGYGLSYTTFELGNFQISDLTGQNLKKRQNMSDPAAGSSNSTGTSANATMVSPGPAQNTSVPMNSTSSAASAGSTSASNSTSSASSGYSGANSTSTSAPSSASASGAAPSPVPSTAAPGPSGPDDTGPSADNPTGTRTVGRFLAPYLQDAQWQVSVDVTNTGSVDGCEVPQLYLVYPPGVGEPPRVLRDFARVNLQPGETKTVSWTLSRYDLSYWNVVKQKWVVPSGEYRAVVATSSFDEGVGGPFCPSGKECS